MLPILKGYLQGKLIGIPILFFAFYKLKVPLWLYIICLIWLLVTAIIYVIVYIRKTIQLRQELAVLYGKLELLEQLRRENQDLTFLLGPRDEQN